VSENMDQNLPREKQADHIYDLYGIVIHAGRSSNSGHYYSFVKKENRWFKCNDESVSEVHNIDQVLKQKAYLMFYKRRQPKPKPEVKPSTAAKSNGVSSPSFAKTKSISVEIKETHAKINMGSMPLSGFMDGSENEANSEEEEEKLVQHEEADPARQKEIERLDYILQNFEDADMDDFKELDMLKNLSVVSLKDDFAGTPELKLMLSSRLQSLSKIPSVSQASSGMSNDGIKVPDMPLRLKKSRGSNMDNGTPKLVKKRDLKNQQKGADVENGSTLDSIKNSHLAYEAQNGKTVSNFQNKKRNKKRNRKKNKKTNGASTNQQFQNLVSKLKH
jgi:hypothetical protein